MHFSIDDVSARAIEWAEERLGSTAYATRCLAFVEDAVERANDLEVFGGDDASESAELFDAASRMGTPPRGAFAFYSATGPIAGRVKNWGHVGLSLGDGLVIHAWDQVRIDDHRRLEALRPAPGWTSPRWLGWVALETVLATARDRPWTTMEAAEDAAQRQQSHPLDRHRAEHRERSQTAKPPASEDGGGFVL